MSRRVVPASTATAPWAVISSPALARDDRGPRAATERWAVPVEMAMACSCSQMVLAIETRIRRGELPDASAEVVVDGAQFLAVVTFGGGRAVYLPLTLQTWRRG